MGRIRTLGIVQRTVDPMRYFGKCRDADNSYGPNDNAS
jgi:hypothetical protein